MRFDTSIYKTAVYRHLQFTISLHTRYGCVLLVAFVAITRVEIGFNASWFDWKVPLLTQQRFQRFACANMYLCLITKKIKILDLSLNFFAFFHCSHYFLYDHLQNQMKSLKYLFSYICYLHLILRKTC